MVDNTVRTNDAEGILVQDLGTDARFEGNEIRDNGGDGVGLDSMRQGRVTENIVRENSGYSDSLTDVRETIVSGNLPCDNAMGPLSEDEGTDNRIGENSLVCEGGTPTADGTTETEVETDGPEAGDTNETEERQWNRIGG